MGWGVAEARTVSLWQFLAAWEGFIQANSPEEEKKLSPKEVDELWDWIEDL